MRKSYILMHCRSVFMSPVAQSTTPKQTEGETQWQTATLMDTNTGETTPASSSQPLGRTAKQSSDNAYKCHETYYNLSVSPGAAGKLHHDKFAFITLHLRVSNNTDRGKRRCRTTWRAGGGWCQPGDTSNTWASVGRAPEAKKNHHTATVDGRRMPRGCH